MLHALHIHLGHNHDSQRSGGVLVTSENIMLPIQVTTTNTRTQTKSRNSQNITTPNKLISCRAKSLGTPPVFPTHWLVGVMWKSNHPTTYDARLFAQQTAKTFGTESTTISVQTSQVRKRQQKAPNHETIFFFQLEVGQSIFFAGCCLGISTRDTTFVTAMSPVKFPKALTVRKLGNTSAVA